MKAIDKLQKEHDNLVKAYEEIGRKIQQQAKELAEVKKERMRVPEEIRFEKGVGFHLVSPNGLCILGASEAYGGITIVSEAGSFNDPLLNLYTEPLYLEPVDYKDLKCGDVVVGLDGEEDIEVVKHDQYAYNVVLDTDTFASWKYEMDVECNVVAFDRYYKVVEE